MTGKRGSALVMVLLLSVFLLIMGMAILAQRSSQYEGAVRGREASQARALAQAGLADFQVKLRKDPTFPPAAVDVESETFSYVETLTDAGGKSVGSYRVSVDASQRVAPYGLLKVTSVGWLGDAGEPRASAEVYAEFDILPTARATPSPSPLPNPKYADLVQYVERDAPVAPSPPAYDYGE